MAPADAPNPLGFDVVRHGFDRAQVQQHVANLESNLRLLTADRDAARAELAALTRELTALREQMTGATQPVTGRAEVHAQLRVMLDVTRAEATQITARAQEAADKTFASVQKASAALRGRYEHLVADLEAQQTQMQAEHAAAMDTLRTQLTEMSTEAETRRRRFGEESDQQHLQIENEFTTAMAARQAALDQEVAARRAESEQKAAKLVAEATADARRRTAEADQKVNQLSTLRQRVSERLRETSQLLTQSSGLLEPLEAEADVISGKTRS
jgi:colicin import membrane protein